MNTIGDHLQTDLPNAYAIRPELTQWTPQHVSRVGTTVELRLVKGANISMERVEPAQGG